MDLNSMEDVLTLKDYGKKYKDFDLFIPELHIKKGIATALIGENGAGKTTLLNLLSGIRLDGYGECTYFGKYKGVEADPLVKEMIGYTGNDNYYLPHWTIKDVKRLSSLLFSGFSEKKFDELTAELSLFSDEKTGLKKKVHELSDGNRTKLMLSSVLARDTSLLLLDEPASSLDPLMRDKLCDLLRTYISNGNGEKSVFFSTHNVSDMENVTDYAIILEKGRVVEEGFVPDLKEKYVLVQGDKKDILEARSILFSISENSFGFTGICLSKDLDRLAGMDISKESASLYDISVAVMKKYSSLQGI